jgi:hypothetical protein
MIDKLLFFDNLFKSSAYPSLCRVVLGSGYLSVKGERLRKVRPQQK